jgi:SAM-dependent methyltransferase
MNDGVTSAMLLDKIRELAPWHHDIQLTAEVRIGQAFGDEKIARKDNEGVSLIEPRDKFFERTYGVFEKGLAGKRFLDCACNAGVYCFYAREADAEFSFGFDVREHWIQQANFIKQHRTVAPTDRIEFQVLDLYDLPQAGLEPFDFTFFSGIFYHLPDPIHGLKIAADITRDVIVVNTASMYDPKNPGGLTPRRRASSEMMMSGVSEMAWFPNGPKAILLILNWMGFREFKLTKFIQRDDRHRFEIVAAREKGRLDNLRGQIMRVRVADYR